MILHIVILLHLFHFEISSSSTQFALNLLRSSSDSSSNFVISPFSLGSALAIVHDGARGNTQTELTKLLAKDLSPKEVSSLYSKLSRDLSSSNSKGVVTTVVNNFFLNKSFNLKSECAAHVAKAYAAGVEQLNFSDGKSSAERVNGVVKNGTGGMIPELVSPDIFKEAAALLINAVYFKGQWMKEFNATETVKRTFHGVKEDRQVSFMVDNDPAIHSHITPELTVVALPYKDTNYSMIIMMPSGDFGSWREGVTADTLGKTMRDMTDWTSNIYDSTVSTLMLPKFKIESTTDGKASLKKLGVSKLFDPSTANLTGISTEPVFVSQIVHKAVIEVSEEGTEASAATLVKIVPFSCCPEKVIITIDRPFIYLIVRGNDDILFIGQHC